MHATGRRCSGRASFARLLTAVRTARRLLPAALLLAWPARLQAQYACTTNDGLITITRYTGAGGAVAVPATLNGLPVDCIGDYAFYGTGLSSVTISSNVTRIGEGAFYACHSLTGATLGGDVTNIGDYAFSDCPSLAAVTVSNRVVGIGTYAFSDCVNLTGIALASNVASIGSYAFAACTRLARFAVPAAVTDIRTCTFNNCTSLTNVTLSSRVTRIGNSAFKGCSSLAGIAIPDGVVSIGSDAFASCSSLTEVAIPGQVSSIEEGAFYACRGLTHVEIPDSVTRIGSYAFSSCSDLTTVHVGNRVAAIGEWGFAGCTSLTGIYFTGDAFDVNPDVFFEDSQTTVYRILGKNGWGSEFGGRPVALWVLSVVATFDAQGGSAPIPASKTVTYGTAYGALATTTRDGFVFGGWWTGADGAGTEVTATTTVTITAPQTLYAKWTASSYTVTFDAQPGTAASPATKRVTYAGSYGTLATTTREGYAFGGWWTGADGAGTEVTATTTVTITAPQTLYAKWTASSYTVTFDAQPGTAASPATKSVTYAGSYGTLATTTREGYAFGGWWTGADGAGTEVTAATTVTITAAQTLYAKWTASSYTVTFDAQGGTVDPTHRVVIYRSDYGTLPVPVRTGRTFAAWQAVTNGVAFLVASNTVVQTPADHTLYAQWLINSHTLTYLAGTNGTIGGMSVQSVSYGADGLAVTAVAEPGYHFARWSDGRTDNPRTDVNVTEDLTVTAAFGCVSFDRENAVVSETDGAVILSVNGGVPGVASSVKIYLQPGTAAASDYTVPPAAQLTLSWAAGEIALRTITIPIKADASVEDDEVFYVLLGNPTNCVIGVTNVCRVTILDANRGDTLADALDNATLAWTTGGMPAWVPQSAVTSDGEDAAASGAMASNRASYVQTSMTGTGTLSFAWSVAGKGVLRLLDGTKALAAVTNDTAWQTRTLRLTNNAAHALKWEFVQGASTNGRAYLDQVVWLPGGRTGVTVTAVASDPAGGTVSGTGTYYAGARVPLNAKPRPGWLFTGWTPTNRFAKPLLAAQTLTVSNSAISVTAKFAKIPVVMGLPRPPEGGAVTGSGLCLPGKSVTLKATASRNWWFMRWSDGMQTASRVVSSGADVTLLAEFKLISQIAVPVTAAPGAQSAMVGVPFRLTLQVASECLPTVTVTGLPAGLRFDAASRLISGVPSAVPVGGRATVKVSASNPGGKAVDVFFMITVAPLTAAAQGTFSGFAFQQLWSGAAMVRGLYTVTVTPAGAISAKVTTQVGAYSFTGVSWDAASSDGVFQVALRTTKGEVLTLVLTTDTAWCKANLQGSLTGGAFGTVALTLPGQRNACLVKTAPDYVAATNALSRYKGYYTVALPVREMLGAPGAATNTPQGSGYLMLTVKDGGAATFTGKLADGTTLSGATTLLMLGVGVAGESAYVPFQFALYSARGVFAGLMELTPAAVGTGPASNAVTYADGFVQVWGYPGKAPTASVPQTADRFSLALEMAGGYYSPLTDLRAYYSNAWFTAQAPGVSNTYISTGYTTTVGVVQAALPEVPLRFDATTGAVSLPVGKAPVYNTGANAYSFAPTNPAVATLSVTRATGLFTGRFNLYYEYPDRLGVHQLKTTSVSHEGVLTPMRADTNAPPGQGFYLVSDTWKSPGAQPVAYPLMRSYGVAIGENE